MSMPFLFMSCCIAVGFVTATSLILTNTVGQLLHTLQEDGSYRYRGDNVEKQRQAVRDYPTLAPVVYLVIVLLFLFISAPYLLDRPVKGSGAQWIMVVFAAAYIAGMLWMMRRFCVALSDAMSNDESGSRRRRAGG